MERLQVQFQQQAPEQSQPQPQPQAEQDRPTVESVASPEDRQGKGSWAAIAGTASATTEKDTGEVQTEGLPEASAGGGSPHPAASLATDQAGTDKRAKRWNQGSSAGGGRGGGGNGGGGGKSSSGTAGPAGKGGSVPAEVLPFLDHKETNYNPKDFNVNPRAGRFFIIKSYSEDDVHKSIKYNVWTSTKHGNAKLNKAFRDSADKGPVYLLFSVNASGHFCGVAEMTSEVDFNKDSGHWEQDKWKSEFDVRWIFVKDVPNKAFKHIVNPINDNKPVHISRDTQEVLLNEGRQILKIIAGYSSTTSLFDDFAHYEQRALESKRAKDQAA